VSVITGELKQNENALSLLRAAFPGGSVHRRAKKFVPWKLLQSLEPTARGPYCGSVGYIGFDGNMDVSIVIRTFTLNGLKVSFQAGGAVVADSIALHEYNETLTKAQALFKTLTVVPEKIYDSVN